MAHLFREMYVDELDFESLSFETIIDLVFTEMVYRQIRMLHQEINSDLDETDGNMLRKCRQSIDVSEDRKCWIEYGEQALSLMNREVIWQGVKEACKALQYPEPSSRHRQYFDSLFDLSCFVWFLIYSEHERTVSIENLLDYVICICKLKFKLNL